MWDGIFGGVGFGSLSEVSGVFCYGNLVCTGLMSSWHWDGNEACKAFFGASLGGNLSQQGMGCVPTHPESNIQVDTNIQHSVDVPLGMAHIPQLLFLLILHHSFSIFHPTPLLLLDI